MAEKKEGAKKAPAKKVKVTVKGVTISIDPNVMDDIDLVDYIGAVQDGDIFAMPRVLKRMFGSDYQRIKAELADKAGVTTVTKFSNFLVEVMTAVNAIEAKN